MRIPAIKVNQWLPEWDEFLYSEDDNQRKPEPYFYVSSMPASILRKLSNIPRRGESTSTGRQQASGLRAADIGIQRGFEQDRSAQIKGFLEGGYPWATLRQSDRERFANLKKPGWLPTAIVLNVLKRSSSRDNTKPDPDDLVRIEETGSKTADLVLPAEVGSPEWRLKGRVRPLEVLDGQHRLLAFQDGSDTADAFELPVVLFEDLDLSWQAYLFWTINISPKRIDRSLAFDLYPLLRTEQWLEPVSGPLAYRETRAQELTEALWSNPQSPWFQRIGMLGRERGKVTQAAFVRSLTLSFIRPSDPRAGRPGGLYGSPVSEVGPRLLPWGRSQQAAYLIFLWSELAQAVADTNADWANDLRRRAHGGQSSMMIDENPAFAGDYSLLSTDQGVRGFLQVTNDISFDLADEIEITSWLPSSESAATMVDEVDQAVSQLREDTRSSDLARSLCSSVATFDWRTQGTPDLPPDVRNRQALYRTGTGYREVRRHVLYHLFENADQLIGDSADRLIRVLGF